MKRSVTPLLFVLTFAAIALVLMSGYLIVTYFSGPIYGALRMREIERNVTSVLDENLHETDGDVFIATMNMLSKMERAQIEIYNNDKVLYKTPENYYNFDNNKSPGKGMGIKPRRFLIPMHRLDEGKWVENSKAIDGGYRLITRVDASVLNRDLMILAQVFRLILPIGAILALGAALLMSLFIARPLKDLKKLASRMEKLDFSVRYEGKRQDEIGQLGRTLNHMMDRLGATLSKLQSEIVKEKDADKVRKRFVAQVSHELKTPLTVIANYVEALQDGMAKNADEQQRYLCILENECRKMGHIVNDLLDLSQMEAGTFNIKKNKFDLAKCVTNIYAKFEELVPDHLVIERNGPRDGLLMKGDPVRIEQVVENFMGNALKHTSEDGRIVLSLSREEENVHISVSNTGSPIPEELLPHIWDSFVKGQDEKGAGLGLSIARNIIILHGGEYYVRNDEKMVTFGCRLPI